MSLPIPEHPLDNACSVLFNNTLYSYSKDAFQSLALAEGAKWSQLSMGESVVGGVCVKATPADESKAALYIVGGNSTASEYLGLQRYTFAKAKWESITPSVAITQNRMYHDAIYLNTSNSVLVFSGRQDGVKAPSSQTFTISLTAPYEVAAFSSIARPAIHPILLPWSDGTAIYVGGSTDNTEVMAFNPNTSWVSTNATLAEPLYNTTAIQATLMFGEDGSKNLFTFDMSVTPNEVNRTVLINGKGEPVENSTAIRKRSLLVENEYFEGFKRADLTAADWPSYNGTMAPKESWPTYSVAKTADPNDGQVVISGNSGDVLCIFNASTNSWTNATEVFTQASTQSVVTTSSTGASSSSSSSTSATASSTATSVSDKFPGKVLGAVLGSLIGAVLILMGILILFRWRRKRRDHAEAGHQRRASGISEEKNTLDFGEKSPSPRQMHSARKPANGHGQQPSQGSFSSMAALMGRVGQRRGSAWGHQASGSDASSNFNKNFKTAIISNPIPHPNPFDDAAVMPKETKEVSFGQGEAVLRPRVSKADRRGSLRRSSGWNRYWSGGSAMTNILGIGSRRSTYDDGSETSSQYSERTRSHGPSDLPPLTVPGQPALFRVNSGSPTVESPPFVGSHHQGISGSIVNPGAEHDDHDQRDWVPSRPSNAYTESVYTSGGPPSTVNNFSFPHPPSTSSRQQPVMSDMSWLNLGKETRI